MTTEAGPGNGDVHGSSGSGGPDEGIEIPVGTDEPSDATARLHAELADYKERYLRAHAEMDNLRKRQARERDDYTRFATRQLLGDLLGVVDNLDLALRAFDSGSPVKDVVDGVRLVHKQFMDLLAQRGVKPFSAANEPFDPNRHEAIQQIETANQLAGSVVAEIKRGYTIADQLLRPALVAVAVHPGRTTEGSEGAA